MYSSRGVVSEAGALASRRRVSVVALAPLLAAAACTPLSPQTDTWMTAKVTTDPLWACLNRPVSLVVPDAAPATATYVAPIVDFYSQPTLLTAIPTLKVDVCGTDPTCSSPITDRVTITHPGAPFVWSFEMPYMLNVSLRTKADGYVDFNYVLGGPLIGTPNGVTTIEGLVIPPITETALDDLYTQVNAGPRDTSKGILAVRTLNCYQNPDGSPDQTKSRGEGVRLEVNYITGGGGPPKPPAVGWALSFMNKARPAVNNVLPPTDSRGVVGYFQLEPGNYEGTAIAPGGAILAHTIWPVYANVVTLAEVRRGLEMWGQ